MMSGYQRLFIWVEGADDEELFRAVITPLFLQRYTTVIVRRYAGDTTEKVNQFLQSIQSMSDADYIFISDIDNAPCVTRKKEVLQARYARLNTDNAIVVKAEIESWYLAGLDDETCILLGLRSIANTDSITKEVLDQLLKKKALSRVAAMREMLHHYNIEMAKQKNESFAYFARKYGL